MILLAGTGGLLFRNPAPAPVEETAVPAAGLLAGSPTPEPAGTPLPGESLPPSPSPLPTFPLLQLRELTPPPEGLVVTITPAPDAVGWARENDEAANHFGDYNVYAGIFDDQVYVGAMQFDLSQVAPGTPILYADLTLVGLSEKWLGSAGSTWRVELLKPWMEADWAQKDFATLQRPDGTDMQLSPALQATDVGAGRANTFVFGPDALEALWARTYSGQAAFRIQGATNGPDDMFTWDSGYGTGSRGQGPLLRLVTGPALETPPPSPTPRYVVITEVPPTPTPENVLTLAVQVMTATAEAMPYDGMGTPTPSPTATFLPGDWVTPVIVVPTATPANAVTAEWQAQVATAQAIAYGTPTPLPPNAWTATPIPTSTPVPMLIPLEQLTPAPSATPTLTPTATPPAVPAALQGKIAFLSDRLGGDEPAVFVMNPDGSNVFLLTRRWIYDLARDLDTWSPDRSQRLFVKQSGATYGIWMENTADGWTQLLTSLGGVSYDPAWSPSSGKIAFVSQVGGNDDVFVIDKDTGEHVQLTANDWEWDKHPSWSPDGNEIVFWSNRESGRPQIWVMNADGSAPRNLSNNEYNETDPVWLK